MENEMLFASATTCERRSHDAAQSLAEQVREQLEARTIDLVVMFMSAHFLSQAEAIGQHLREALHPRVLLGVTGEGVIGRAEEIETEPAITLLAAHMPGIELCPFALNTTEWSELLGDQIQFHKLIAAPRDLNLFILFADPFSTPIEEVLDAFNVSYPRVPVVGGMASAAYRPGGNALLLNEQLLTMGAIGVALAGDFEADVIVSQGCRPIGYPLKVTESERNVISGLEGEPPLAQIRHIVSQLPNQDQALLQANGIFIGRAIETNTERVGRGDFLIRGMMGVDTETGAIAVADYVHPGETIQFHLRDQRTAEEDLEMLLLPQALLDPPRSALLFACNGRGTRLYDHPNGDVATIQKILGGVSLAGFFCAGEIGPLGRKNFLHGQTASMVLFRPKVEATNAE